MTTARVNGIDIWYERAGSGPPMILHHGFAGPTGGWPPVAYELRERFDLLLYDARAHGKTTVPDDPETVTIPQMAADMAGLMDALGIDRAIIAGVSMGGMVSAQFACDFPERVQSLWLCDTTAGNGCDPETAEVEARVVEIFETYDRIVRKYGLEGLVERENRYRHESDPHAKYSSYTLEEQDARNHAGKVGRMTVDGYLAAAKALRTRPDLTARTPSIQAPTLVSCGEWDLFYPLAQRDGRLIPNCRMATVRRAAHDTTNYRPQVWKRVFLDFMDDLEAGRDVRGEVEYA